MQLDSGPKLYTSFTSLWLKYIRAKSWWRTARPTFSSDLGQMSWHIPLQSDIEIQNVLLHHGPDAAKQTQTMTGWLWLCSAQMELGYYVGMQCFPLFWQKRWVFYLSPKRCYFGLICQQNIVPKAFWHVCVIFSKLLTGSSVLFAALPCTPLLLGFPWWCQCERSIFYF